MKIIITNEKKSQNRFAILNFFSRKARLENPRDTPGGTPGSPGVTPVVPRGTPGIPEATPGYPGVPQGYPGGFPNGFSAKKNSKSRSDFEFFLVRDPSTGPFHDLRTRRDLLTVNETGLWNGF